MTITVNLVPETPKVRVDFFSGDIDFMVLHFGLETTVLLTVETAQELTVLLNDSTKWTTHPAEE